MSNWQPGQPLRLETKNFYMKTFMQEDITDAYVSWWNDPEIQAGFGFPARNWNKSNAITHVLQFNNQDKFHFGIYVKQSNELIGFYTLFYETEIGIAVPNICIGNKNYWGKHVATEVGRAFYNFGFNILGANKAEGRVKGNNKASIAMLVNDGFKKEGQIRQRLRDANGQRVDFYIYGLLKEEWLASLNKDGS